MSSCYKKNVNIEKYGEPPRTAFDQYMNKVYSPQNYYSAPFPMDRTKYDMRVINTLAPNCEFGFKSTGNDTLEKYDNNILRTPYDQYMEKVYSPQNYYSAPFPMERTQRDVKVQEKLSPNCGVGFVGTPSSGQKNVLNPANIYGPNSKENYCGEGGGRGFANNVALALEDNDNVWSYNSKYI